MALFRYRAWADGGKKSEGLLDADSFQEGLQLLQKRNLTVTFFKEVEAFEKSKTLLAPKEAIMFFHSLSKLLEAGIPLYDALLALKERQTNVKSRLFVADVCQRIKSGQSFAKALSFHERSIDILTVSMIANGERSGSLSTVVLEIANLLLRQNAQKKQIVSALIYPSILLSFCTILISVLFFFVIPSLYELFNGRSLHPLTKVVIMLSRFASDNRFTILFSFMGLIAMGIYFFVQPTLKKKMLAFFTKLPFVKNIFILSALSKFCRGFSSLLTSGVELPVALKLATNLTTHQGLKSELEKVLPHLIEGQKLSQLLGKISYVPKLVPQMISVAEESGQMDKMFGFLGKIFEEELEKDLSRITTMIQPSLIVFLGIVIGLVVLSVLLPLTDVSSFLPD